MASHKHIEVLKMNGNVV